jgi:hypothetical protein
MAFKKINWLAPPRTHFYRNSKLKTMAAVNIYLTFDDNYKDAFEFYKSVFRGDFPYIGLFGHMPVQEGMPPLSNSDKSKIFGVLTLECSATNLV